MAGWVDTGVGAGVIIAVVGAAVGGAAGLVVCAGVVFGALPPVQPATTMARTRHPARTRVKIPFFFKCSVTAQTFVAWLFSETRRKLYIYIYTL
jgi:hypothetical protein